MMYSEPMWCCVSRWEQGAYRGGVMVIRHWYSVGRSVRLPIYSVICTALHIRHVTGGSGGEGLRKRGPRKVGREGVGV